jgi:hypothetical protein
MPFKFCINLITCFLGLPIFFVFLAKEAALFFQNGVVTCLPLLLGGDILYHQKTGLFGPQKGQIVAKYDFGEILWLRAVFVQIRRYFKQAAGLKISRGDL